MMTRLAIACLGLMLASPAIAQSEDTLLQTIRDFGNGTAGHDAGGADKLLMLGREGGRIVLTGLTASPSDQWPRAPARTFAILRTRAATPGNNGAPDPADIAYVQRTGLRVFIAGEWADPPVIWEVARQGRQVRVREIDAGARPGPWRAAAP